jgi:hypothetical protein
MGRPIASPILLPAGKSDRCVGRRNSTGKLLAKEHATRHSGCHEPAFAVPWLDDKQRMSAAMRIVAVRITRAEALGQNVTCV